MNQELCFGQKIDPATGYVMPWFTHGALDEIAETDWSDKVVWQWGAGLGDTWIAKKCKRLYSVERNPEWIIKARSIGHSENIEYIHRSCNDCSGMQDYYCEIPEDIRPDIFIVDDAYRYECIVKALEYKPCILIVDNWQQDFVFICPAAEEALKDYEGKFFIQPDHKDHEGRPWQTAIFYLK